MFVRFAEEHTQEFRWHADQLTLTREAHIEHIRTAADDLAMLVQPRQQHPVLRMLGDLLHPTEQRNPSAIDITPPIPGRVGRVSGHGAPSLLVVWWPAGRREPSVGGRSLNR